VCVFFCPNDQPVRSFDMLYAFMCCCCVCVRVLLFVVTPTTCCGHVIWCMHFCVVVVCVCAPPNDHSMLSFGIVQVCMCCCYVCIFLRCVCPNDHFMRSFAIVYAFICCWCVCFFFSFFCPNDHLIRSFDMMYAVMCCCCMCVFFFVFFVHMTASRGRLIWCMRLCVAGLCVCVCFLCGF